MQLLPIDLTAIIAIVMGMLVVLIPIAGLTARYALKPLVESLAHLWEQKGAEQSLAIAERRLALLEQQMEVIEGSLHQLQEGQAFDRQLRAPRADAPAAEGERAR
jgi:hypothetical protein